MPSRNIHRPCFGSTFTVTSTTISGNVGSSGIAVIYNGITQEPSVTFTPKGGSFITETQNVTATLNNASSGWYKIGNGTQQSFTGTATFTIGSGMSVGESITVSWSATGEKDTKTGSVTFTKADPSAVVRVYYNNPENWGSVNCYMYMPGTNPVKQNAAWPGQTMTKDTSTGLWYYEVPEDYRTGSKVIFNGGSGSSQYPADVPGETCGLDLNGQSMICKNNSTWETYTGGAGGTGGGGGGETGSYPSTLYLIGTLNSWNTSTPVPATGSNGVYIWYDTTLPNAGGSDAGKTFFSFLTRTGSHAADWDTGVNQADRYGAQSKDAPIAVGSSASIRKFAVNVDASSAYSWQTTPGTYTITANLATNTLTLSNTTGIGKTEAAGKDFKVYSSDGRLYIIADKAATIKISTLSGMTIVRKVNAGTNIIEGLAHGVYIVNRTKVII